MPDSLLIVASGYDVVIKSCENLKNAPEYKRMPITCQPEGTDGIGDARAERT
jgi:hypothetical protein